MLNGELQETKFISMSTSLNCWYNAKTLFSQEFAYFKSSICSIFYLQATNYKPNVECVCGGCGRVVMGGNGWSSSQVHSSHWEMLQTTENQNATTAHIKH